MDGYTWVPLITWLAECAVSKAVSIQGKWKWSESCSVVSDSLQPHGLWTSPGQNTGAGSLSLLQGIFPTQGSNPGLPHYGWILYQLSPQGSPIQGKVTAAPRERQRRQGSSEEGSGLCFGHKGTDTWRKHMPGHFRGGEKLLKLFVWGGYPWSLEREAHHYESGHEVGGHGRTQVPDSDWQGCRVAAASTWAKVGGTGCPEPVLAEGALQGPHGSAPLFHRSPRPEGSWEASPSPRTHPWVHSQSRGTCLKQEELVSFCNTASPQCKLEDKEAWLENGSLNNNTTLRLDFVKGREIR